MREKYQGPIDWAIFAFFMLALAFGIN